MLSCLSISLRDPPLVGKWIKPVDVTTSQGIHLPLKG